MDTPRMKTRSVSRREGTPVSSVVTVEVKTSTGKRGRPSKSAGNKKMSYTIRTDGTTNSPIVLVLGGADQNQSMVLPQILNSAQPEIAEPTPPAPKQGVYHMIYSDGDDSDVSASSSPDNTLEMLQNQLKKLQNLISNYQPKKRRKNSNETRISKRQTVEPKRLRLDTLEPAETWDNDVDSFLNSDNFLQEFSENWGETVNNEAVTSDSGLAVSSVCAETVDNCDSALLKNNPSRWSEVEDDADDLPLAQVLRKTSPSKLTQFSQHSLNDRILKQIQEEIDNEVNDSPDGMNRESPQAGTGMYAASEDSDSWSWPSDCSDEAKLIRERMKQSWQKVKESTRTAAQDNGPRSSEEAAVLGEVNQLQGRVMKNWGRLLNKSGQIIDDSGPASSNASSVEVEFCSTDHENNVFKLPDLPNLDESEIPNDERQTDSNDVIFRSLDIFETPVVPEVNVSEKELNGSQIETGSQSPDCESAVVLPLLAENISVNWDDIPKDSSSSDDEEVACILRSKPPPKDEDSEASSLSDDDDVSSTNETPEKKTPVVLAQCVDSSSSDDDSISVGKPGDLKIPVLTVNTTQEENSKVSSSFHLIDAVDTSDDEDEPTVGNVPALASKSSSSRPEVKVVSKKEVEVTKQTCDGQEDFPQSNGAKVSCGSAARFRDQHDSFSSCGVDDVANVNPTKISQNLNSVWKEVVVSVPTLKLHRVQFRSASSSSPKIKTLPPAQAKICSSDVECVPTEIRTTKRPEPETSSICDRLDTSEPPSPANASSRSTRKGVSRKEVKIAKQPCKHQEDCPESTGTDVSCPVRDEDNSAISYDVDDLYLSKIASPILTNNGSKNQNSARKETVVPMNLPTLKLHRVQFKSASSSSPKIKTVPPAQAKSSSSDVEDVPKEIRTTKRPEPETSSICDRLDTLEPPSPANTTSSVSDSKDLDSLQNEDEDTEVPKNSSPITIEDTQPSLPVVEPSSVATTPFRNDEEDVAKNKLVSPASSISENEHNLDDLNIEKPPATSSACLELENSNCSSSVEHSTDSRQSAEKITFPFFLKPEDIKSSNSCDEKKYECEKIEPPSSEEENILKEKTSTVTCPIIPKDEDLDSSSGDELIYSGAQDPLPKIHVQFLPKNEYWCNSHDEVISSPQLLNNEHSDASSPVDDLPERIPSSLPSQTNVTKIMSPALSVKNVFIKKIDFSDTSDDEEVINIPSDCETVSLEWPQKNDTSDSSDEDVDCVQAGSNNASIQKVTDEVVSTSKDEPKLSLVAEQVEEIPKKLTRRRTRNTPLDVDEPQAESPRKTPKKQVKKKLVKENIEENEPEILDSPKKVTTNENEDRVIVDEIETKVLKSPAKVNIDRNENLGVEKTESNVVQSPRKAKKKPEECNDEEIKVELEAEKSPKKVNIDGNENLGVLKIEHNVLKSPKKANKESEKFNDEAIEVIPEVGESPKTIAEEHKIEPNVLSPKKAKRKKIEKENEIKVEPETVESPKKAKKIPEESQDEAEVEPEALKSEKNSKKKKTRKGTESKIKPKVLESPEELKKINPSDDESTENHEEPTTQEMTSYSGNDEIARLPDHFLKDLAAVKAQNPPKKVKKMKIPRELIQDKIALVNHGSTEFSARVAVNSAGREQLAGDFKQRLLYGDRVRRAPSQSLKVIAMKRRF